MIDPEQPCSARSGAFHSLLCRRSGTSLIYCFNTERGVLLSFGMPPSHRAIVVDTFSIYCLLCAKRPVHKRSAGGLNFHLPLRCSTSSITNIQSKRALGGVLSGGTLPEEPVYMLLWLSNCEWNAVGWEGSWLGFNHRSIGGCEKVCPKDQLLRTWQY